MINGGAKAGYTIVEVLIFLVVSGVLFVSAILAISGRQTAVEFQQATRDAQNQMNDIINQISSGFYPKTDNIVCKVVGVGTAPIITAGAAGAQTQGSSDDCVFLGKTAQFTKSTSFKLITIAGRKYGTGNIESSSLATAKPVAIISPSTPVDITENKNFQNNLAVTCVGMPSACSGAAPNSAGAIMFVGSFPSTTSTGNLASGTQHISFGVLPSSALTDTSLEVDANIAATATAPVFLDNPNGVVICFADTGGTGKNRAKITMGGANHGGGQLVANLDILTAGDTTCP